MKKCMFLLIFSLLFISSSISSSNTSQVANCVKMNYKKRSKAGKVKMEWQSTIVRARSVFEPFLVLQFEDRLEILAMKPFSAKVEITDKIGNYKYDRQHSLHASDKITIITDNFEMDTYTINIIFSKDEYCSGDFIINY